MDGVVGSGGRGAEAGVGPDLVAGPFAAGPSAVLSTSLGFLRSIRKGSAGDNEMQLRCVPGLEPSDIHYVC